jgi:Protein of unknown function (DUF3309)
VARFVRVTPHSARALLWIILVARINERKPFAEGKGWDIDNYFICTRFVLIGTLAAWPHSRSWDYYPSTGLPNPNERGIMLQSIKQLYGNKLGATDGEIGHVNDFYFDDKSWAVRYVIADTGSWLPGRQVLISARAFGGFHQAGKVLSARLSRKQIEESPAIEFRKPVSRQYEEEYHRYYGWPFYWEGDGLWGGSEFPILFVPPKTMPHKETAAGNRKHEHADVHLRSAQAVNGYHIKAIDGIIGHVCDFMMDNKNWAICQLVIKTGHRFTGKEVQIPVGKVDRISYEDSTVFVNLTMDAIEQSSAHGVAPVNMAA